MPSQRHRRISCPRRINTFAVDCPEGGAIPQFIVGSLIRHLRANDPNYQSVEGVEESVFGTNTTSKKPADIWEVLADGSIGQLYEITSKKINFKRLDDCVDSLARVKLPNRIITFICNIPDNIEPLDTDGNFIIHEGVVFQFLDMRSFIMDTFLIIGASAQAALVEELRAFVSEVHRGVKTKDYWNTTFLSGAALAEV